MSASWAGVFPPSPSTSRHRDDRDHSSVAGRCGPRWLGAVLLVTAVFWATVVVSVVAS